MTEQLKVISEPEQKKQIPGKSGGALIVWAIELARGSNGDSETVSAEVLRVPGFPPPSEGSEFTGELEESQYGWKLKLPDGVGGKGGGGGGRPRTSPEERRSIERQVSAKIAAEALFSIDRDAERQDVEDWGKKFRWIVDEVHDAIRGE